MRTYPVVLFGHGYGSSRLDFLGFAYAFNRFGMAACAGDFPGHGPTVDEDEEELLKAFLYANGLLEVWDMLYTARFRDMDNDGRPDSGGDQWSADTFHVRDIVRQAAVDWMAMIDSFEACGTGTMSMQGDGGNATSCDWDGDGTPDIGGPGNDYYVVGGSLGGINAAVAAGVIPEVTAWSPIVGGAGLMDVAVRTEISGAVEAMVGRLVSPMFVGVPDESGGLGIRQISNSVFDMVELRVTTLSDWPAGGRVLLENLVTGESHEGWMPEDGTFRVAIAADAASATAKRLLTGMPDTGPVVGEQYTVTGNAYLGDTLRLTVYEADGTEVAVVDSWEVDTVHEGVTYLAGSPLVAANEGLGHVLATPRLRRVAFMFSSVLEPGDPVAYAPISLAVGEDSL